MSCFAGQTLAPAHGSCGCERLQVSSCYLYLPPSLPPSLPPGCYLYLLRFHLVFEKMSGGRHTKDITSCFKYRCDMVHVCVYVAAFLIFGSQRTIIFPESVDCVHQYPSFHGNNYIPYSRKIWWFGSRG